MRLPGHTPPDIHRTHLLQIFHAALAAVEGRRCVRDWLMRHPVPGEVALLAIGKAAASMAQGALDVPGAQIRRGLVITRHGHLGDLAHPLLHCIEAGHPVPDAHSLRAGDAVTEFVAGLPAGQPLLALISGGASALIERLPAGMNLADLQRVNDWLLGSGLPIQAMNRVRQGLSCLKAGRLALLMQGRPVLCLLLSDVPGDDPAVIGSGPLAPVAPSPLPAGLPDWLRDLLQRTPPIPPVESPAFARIALHVVASNRQARLAAAEAARGLGYPVHVHDHLVTGDAVTMGEALAAALRQGLPGLHVRGGETTVRLPLRPGRGGRCQSLALAAAIKLAGHDGLYLLAAGTDGRDGPGEDAGALVDGGSVARGALEGLDPQHCLAAADAGRFLEASGDLIHTGVTGTNVMDLMLGLNIRG